jgi:hypothetical protein
VRPLFSRPPDSPGGQRAGSQCVAICADQCVAGLAWATTAQPGRISGRARLNAQPLHPITLLQKSAIWQGTDARLGTDCTS